jgi:hypothetical protein
MATLTPEWAIFYRDYGESYDSAQARLAATKA